MVKIQDIARIVGKSHATVSRALNGNTRINIETRKEICAIAAQMGYRPSFAGKALREGCTKILSVLVPDLSDPFYAEFINGLRLNASKDGYDVVIYDYDRRSDLELRYLEMMLGGCCDGVVAFITSFEHTKETVERYWASKIPLVAVGTPDTREINYDLITVNLLDGLSEILGILSANGRKHPAYILESMSPETLSRVRSFILDRWNNPPADFEPKKDIYCLPPSGVSQADDGYRIAKRIMREKPETDVIMTWHAVQAYGAARALIEEGVRIPDDVAVVTCDHTWITNFAPCPLITLDQHLDLLSKDAWGMIRNRLLNKDEWLPPQRAIIQATVLKQENFFRTDKKKSRNC
ncbi:MAG: LacI family transcriptional regulator [Lentisphaeria bacterium]|nr:LacI family transcriptional regulator [Lentisphaeria bacterium]